MLEEDFARHGISTQVISDSRTCEYVLTYTALRSWDLTVYLSHAELHLFRNGRQIASAEYHLNGKGGLALTKFKSTESKMDGVMDQLLAGYDADSNVSFESDTVYSQNVYAELQQLDALRNRGIITEAEFDEEKRELLDSN